jgi:hypothetical protein
MCRRPGEFLDPLAGHRLGVVAAHGELCPSMLPLLLAVM